MSMLVSQVQTVYPGGNMALAPSLISQVKERLGQTPGEDVVLDLSGGRKAFCFRGENASERAIAAHANSQLMPITGVFELHQDTYCFVA